MPFTFKKNQLVICDGDSMTNRRSTGNPDTWPFLRLMNWDKPWPDYMAEMLFCWKPELGLTFFNAASGGSTCRDVAQRFEERVLARKPAWVIATVAGNDANRGIPTREYREIMTTYARRLTGEIGARVLLWGLGKHGTDYPAEKKQTMDKRRAYYAILADIAAKTSGVHYRDIGPAVAAKATALKQQHELHTIYGDGGHLNAIGNLIVAGEMLKLFGVVN